MSFRLGSIRNINSVLITSFHTSLIKRTSNTNWPFPHSAPLKAQLSNFDHFVTVMAETVFCVDIEINIDTSSRYRKIRPVTLYCNKQWKWSKSDHKSIYFIYKYVINVVFKRHYSFDKFPIKNVKNICIFLFYVIWFLFLT